MDAVLVSTAVPDWQILRFYTSKLLGYNPSNIIGQCPVNITQDAEVLLFATIIKLGITVDRIDPLHLLRTVPRECMDFLHYTILIACTQDTFYDLKDKTRVKFVEVDCDKYYYVLGTGPLSVWYDAVLFLNRPELALKEAKETRALLSKILLILEKCGLHYVFDSYRKKLLPDKTLLLESK